MLSTSLDVQSNQVQAKLLARLYKDRKVKVLMSITMLELIFFVVK